MRLEDFHFELPEHCIAKFPVLPRDHCKLMVIDPIKKVRHHFQFLDLPKFLRPGDLLVLNESKVIHARLFGEGENGRKFEILLLKAITASKTKWECLVKPGRKVKDRLQVNFPNGRGEISRTSNGFEIEFRDLEDTFFEWLEKSGEPPIPPYLNREATSDDKINYQTIYAKSAGSIAAPTAGLHFTETLIKAVEDIRVDIAKLTLHVGYGTFAPIENIATHQMHKEFYQIPTSTLETLDKTRSRGGRIIAVGTTTLRALESLPAFGPEAETDIFIQPGYQFKKVDGLITNFHLPQSSLLLLVAALMGKELTLESYRNAISEHYRFYSFGDAMLILNDSLTP